MRKITMMQSQWKADTQTGENLQFKNCKGGYFSAIDDYGLKVIGKTSQDEKCVKVGTKMISCGNNLFNNKKSNTVPLNENGDFVINRSLLASLWFDYRVTEWFKPNTQYIFSYDYIVNKAENNRISIAFYYTDGTNDVKWFGNPNITTPTGFNAILTSDANKTISYAGISYATSTRTFDAIISNVQCEEGTKRTSYEPYGGCEIVVPCDLYEGDIWYPMTGNVNRNDGTIEKYDSQPCFAMPGTINVIQKPLELPCELSATMLVRR